MAVSKDTQRGTWQFVVRVTAANGSRKRSRHQSPGALERSAGLALHVELASTSCAPDEKPRTSAGGSNTSSPPSRCGR